MKTCDKHPKYKVLRPPKCDCDTCWKMYSEKYNKEKAIQEYLRFFERKDLTKKNKMIT